ESSVLLPSERRSQNRSVVDRADLAACRKLLRETERIAAITERAGSWIVLNVILHGQTISVAEDVIHVGVSLIDIRCRIGALDSGVIAQRPGGGRVGDGCRRNQIL